MVAAAYPSGPPGPERAAAGRQRGPTTRRPVVDAFFEQAGGSTPPVLARPHPDRRATAESPDTDRSWINSDTPACPLAATRRPRGVPRRYRSRLASYPYRRRRRDVCRYDPLPKTSCSVTAKVRTAVRSSPLVLAV